MLLMELKQTLDINIGYAIAIGKHEFIAVDPRFDSLDASARERLFPGVDQRHGPVRRPVWLRSLDPVILAAQVNGEILVINFIVVEVLLDDLSPVTKGEHKLLEAVVCVYHHNMPQNGLRADLHHWLRPEFGLFAQTRPQTPAEDNHFHATRSAA